jgi:hypothetical protein
VTLPAYVSPCSARFPRSAASSCFCRRAVVAGSIAAWLLLSPAGLRLPGFPDYDICHWGDAQDLAHKSPSFFDDPDPAVALDHQSFINYVNNYDLDHII